VLVVSVDRFNRSGLGLVVACPLSRSSAPKPLNVWIDPPEANLTFRSVVLAEHVRSISFERLGPRVGRVSPFTLGRVEDRLRRLFDLQAPRLGHAT
jgi:mRNA-degrading endonuclease toxin of MazEF toxin-antitoxin module